MKLIFGLLLWTLFITGCINKESCDTNKNRVFVVKFPSAFPFGRHEYLDSLELKIGGKRISYDNPSEEICLDFTDTPDTIFCGTKNGKYYSVVLAKFKNGETYSVHYNDCQGEFQLHPKVDTDLIVQYRIKVTNLKKGDTLQIMSEFSDGFFIIDSSRTNWDRISFSANCNNAFKYLSIGKAYGVKRKCEENDSTWCYLEADSTFNLEQITFQQLHNEKLDIEYDYLTRKMNIKIK